MRELLADRVYHFLMAKLSARQYPIGLHLNALTIAKELEISRTPVNTAMLRLIEEGWVRPDKGRRPIVVSYPANKSANGEVHFAFVNRTERIYQAIMRKILAAEYQLGQILKVRRLAKELKANPITVRRATEWLCNDGLLVRLPRRGWQVIALRLGDLKDIYLMRRLLECLALRRAVERISEVQLKELENETEQMLAKGHHATMHECRQADFKFHQALSKASGSRILVETLEPLLRRAFLMSSAAAGLGRRNSRTFEEHRAILQAVRDQDAEAACQRLKTHLRRGLQRTLAVWEHV